jgi:hypothetical protein
MLLLIILIATIYRWKNCDTKTGCDGGRSACCRRHPSPTAEARGRSAYIDPNDGVRPFCLDPQCAQRRHRPKKWQDLGRKLRNQACADDLFEDSIQHSYVRRSTATLINPVKLSVSFSSTIADRFSLRPLSTIVTLEPPRIAPLPAISRKLAANFP